MSSSRDLPKLTESFPLDYENEYPSLTVDFDKALITQKSSVDSTVEVADEQGTSSVDIYQGKDNYFVFSVDEPTVSARDGNQIIGDFGLSYDGVTSSQSAFSIQVIDMVGNDPAVTKNASYEAMSAKKFKQIFEAELFNGKDVVDVSRSSTWSQAMGFTYTVFFRHSDVGENIELVGTDNSGLSGDDAEVVVTELTAGAQIYGTFQLTFDGYTTGAMEYNVEASDMESMINALPSVSPSAVAVTRSEPMKTGPAFRDGTQVGGYIWSITFMSNKWADPTVDHDEDYTPGNWVGEAVSYDAVWSTGTSKAWGKNVGNMPEMACLGGGLYTSNGQMPTDGCSVAEETMGTEPLGGFFRVSLDTHNHLVINQQGTFQSGYIYHNAVASRVDSSGDGSSMEEMLEGMSNIGDVEVSRSAVNLGGNNGGYTWTITFLRDKDSSGGRFGGCEQKDDKYGLCNSQGMCPCSARTGSINRATSRNLKPTGRTARCLTKPCCSERAVKG